MKEEDEESESLALQFPSLYKVSPVQNSLISSSLGLSPPLTGNFNCWWTLTNSEMKYLERLMSIQ